MAHRPLAATRRARTLLALVGVAVMRAAIAQENRIVAFDAAFLPDGPSTLDVTRFARGNPVLPGTYDVDIWLNDEWQARQSIRFASGDEAMDAVACLDADDLVAFGVDAAAVQPIGDPCEPLARRVRSASVRFDVGEQRLDIEVPQAALQRRRGDVAAPAQWDEGVTAMTLAWRGGARRADARSGSNVSSYLSADAGLHHGPWRLRHAGAMASGRYRRGSTYVERHLVAWRSQVRIGDVVSAGDLFPPVPFRGVSLASDPRMSGNGMGNAAPRISGVAATRATVRIAQHGIVLREVVVPPGPFVIDDFYASGRAGDIDVDVEENDGHHQRFRVPYFPVPERLGEGRTVVSFDAGRMPGANVPANVAQATWRHGFPGEVTAYTGCRETGGVFAMLVGGAVDTLAGALAADTTHAVAGHERARSWRLRHGIRWGQGSILSTSMSGGRDIVRARHRDPAGLVSGRRIDMLLQRDLGGERGYLNVSIGRASRAADEASVEHALSWTRSWNRLSLDLSLRHTRRDDGTSVQRDVSGQFGVSMPLGVPSPAQLHAATQASTHAAGGRLGLHGAVGNDADTTYTVALAHETAEGARVDASVGRRFGGAEISAAVDRSVAARTVALAASGGVVVHAGGVTFAQRLGDATGLAHAAGARGARLGGYSGVRLDRHGYAVLPSLMPYRWNAVDIDPTGVSLDVAMGSTHRRVAPTAGAVVLVPFVTQVGQTHLVVARRADGAPLPFGAEVVDHEGRSAGIVGQGGLVFLRAGTSASHWTARWSGDPPGTCELRLGDAGTTAAGDIRHTGVCE